MRKVRKRNKTLKTMRNKYRRANKNWYRFLTLNKKKRKKKKKKRKKTKNVDKRRSQNQNS